MSKKYYERLAKTGGTSSRAFQSDFGRRILMKYGWEEGKGLGRNEEGDVGCIQIFRREEKRGLGAESAPVTKDWENWWANCFNNVAKKISVSASASSASAANDSSSSESEDEGESTSATEGGRVTAVKSARVQQGKIRRVQRQEGGTLKRSAPAGGQGDGEDGNATKRLKAGG